VLAVPDQKPLERIEIIKGEWKDVQLLESRIQVGSGNGSDTRACIIWSDPISVKGCQHSGIRARFRKKLPDGPNSFAAGLAAAMMSRKQLSV